MFRSGVPQPIRRVSLPTFLGRPATAREVARGVDQHHVGERLRKVAQQAVGPGIILLGQQADIPA
jgi:hypothetical protein